MKNIRIKLIDLKTSLLIWDIVQCTHQCYRFMDELMFSGGHATALQVLIPSINTSS